MQSKEESFLDPKKEIEVDENLTLEGFPLEFEKQMSNITAGEESYNEATPIRMYPVRKTTKDLIEYRKKRNKKNKAAKKARKINRKKKK